MNCTEARDAMLVAEPSELRGDGSTALGVHLTTCPRCLAHASGLARDLDDLTNAVLTRRAVGSWPRRHRLALLAGVPIAAGLLIAVMTRSSRTTATPTTITRTPSRSVSVEVAPGQSAAVFSTSDPAITVVWLSSGVGQ